MNIPIRKAILLVLAMVFSLSISIQLGCGGTGEDLPLALAATSDLQETGILQAWIEDFKSQSGIEVELSVAVDTEVLQMSQHGECDLLITHSPAQEERLERSNYVEGRQEIMRDQYVIVGPPADPAGIRGAGTSSEALSKIAEAKAPFIMRVDDSGTSYKTVTLWSSSGVRDIGDWMIESEAGMIDVLRQASQQGAYTLSDLSNFQTISDELDLEVLVEGGEDLRNSYQVMLVSTLVYPDTAVSAGQELKKYLLSERARRFFNLGAWEPPSE